jgi:hypothetical protein
MGCASLVADATEAGAAHEDIAVSLDMLEEQGYDAFVQFLSEQTDGQYPPRGRLLQNAVPQSILDKLKTPFNIRRSVWWDCLTFDGTGQQGAPTPQRSNRIFGNRNIGLLPATNLQVAGQLAYDGTVYIAGWSVTTNVTPEDKPLVDDLLSSAFATFNLGDRPQSMRRMADLLKEAHPIEHVIPVRQNLMVDISFHDGCLERFQQSFHPTLRPLRIWINLEGWEMRRDWSSR